MPTAPSIEIVDNSANEQSPPEALAQYWYDQPGAIEHRFYGVFEGGGAKGVAYAGALEAMAGNGCWFKAVAGASAGAITAALVAAGLSHKEIEEKTDTALKLLLTGRWAGLRSLQKATGYFPTDKLRAWLNDLFKEQVSRKTGAVPHEEVTFRALYAATRIELNIVAADLSLRRQIVFSHKETPDCAVTEAVVASSSIPFAFPSCLLQVFEDNDKTNPLYHHTIVDGGVWSNFPMYIFEDDAFRAFYERDPPHIESGHILGFLLQEGDAQKYPKGDDVKFVRQVPNGEFRAREWRPDTKTADVTSNLWSKIGAGALFPFSLLGRFADWKSERGRWPTPRSRMVRNLIHSVNGLLGAINTPILGIFACFLVAVGAWETTGFFVSEQVSVIPTTDWSHPLSYFSRLFGLVLTGSLVAVGILFLFVTLLGIVANYILLRASRRILCGLVTTYVAGPGAAEWVANRKNVIALPIPPTVNTLSFQMKGSERRELVEDARRATHARLSQILSNGANES